MISIPTGEFVVLLQRHALCANNVLDEGNSTPAVTGVRTPSTIVFVSKRSNLQLTTPLDVSGLYIVKSYGIGTPAFMGGKPVPKAMSGWPVVPPYTMYN